MESLDPEFTLNGIKKCARTDMSCSPYLRSATSGATLTTSTSSNEALHWPVPTKEVCGVEEEEISTKGLCTSISRQALTCGALLYIVHCLKRHEGSGFRRDIHNIEQTLCSQGCSTKSLVINVFSHLFPKNLVVDTTRLLRLNKCHLCHLRGVYLHGSSPPPPHFSFLSFFGQSCATSRWRVCYQQGLPCLFCYHLKSLDSIVIWSWKFQGLGKTLLKDN